MDTYEGNIYSSNYSNMTSMSESHRAYGSCREFRVRLIFRWQCSFFKNRLPFSFINYNIKKFIQQTHHFISYNYTKFHTANTLTFNYNYQTLHTTNTLDKLGMHAHCYSSTSTWTLLRIKSVLRNSSTASRANALDVGVLNTNHYLVVLSCT